MLVAGCKILNPKKEDPDDGSEPPQKRAASEWEVALSNIPGNTQLVKDRPRSPPLVTESQKSLNRSKNQLKSATLTSS